jgi:hypothetical protein
MFMTPPALVFDKAAGAGAKSSREGAPHTVLWVINPGLG